MELWIGTVWTACAHIITAAIGAGVLSLAWAMSQLGWIAGVCILLLFSAISLYTANLLADCYRSPDPVTGKRNYSYMETVKATLGTSFSSIYSSLFFSFLFFFSLDKLLYMCVCVSLKTFYYYTFLFSFPLLWINQVEQCAWYVDGSCMAILQRLWSAIPLQRPKV